MTLLSQDDLHHALGETNKRERLVVTPLLDPKQVGPGSIDLRLGSDFLLMRRTRGAGLDPGRQGRAETDDLHERVSVPLGDALWLHPQQFVLGATLEFIRLPTTLGAYVLGRSSWGRVGLIVATAVMVQPGYNGTLTLELVNEGDAPIALYPGLRVAQLAVHRLETPASKAYTRRNAKYLAPIGPQTTRLAWDKAEMARVKRVASRLDARK